jgi:DNA-binding transcriptional regulator YiaG
MASFVVCAERASWQQAGRFAEKIPGTGELRSFDDRRWHALGEPILVYLTHPEYDHLRSLLGILKPGTPDVVIYYAARPAPEEAAELGKLVGEMRPKNTTVVFEAKAAAASLLRHARSSGPKRDPVDHGQRIRSLREDFGLTQTELAHALGVSLRTIQNWERSGEASRSRGVRDLEELWDLLKDSVKAVDIPTWLRSANDAFDGRRPIDLLKDGKARDIVVEFRRLQAGEPV